MNKENTTKNFRTNRAPFHTLFLSVVAVAIISFILNLFWENAQAPLYQGYDTFWQHFWICLPATLWDVVIILFIYGIIALIHRDSNWLVHTQPSFFWRKTGWKAVFTSIILGTFIAVFIEKRALAEGRWEYTTSMPLIPIPFIPGGDVALFPVLQMIILPILTFYLVQILLLKYGGSK